MFDIQIEIRGNIDSKALWSLIERYGVNLTDLGNVSLVYGTVKTFHDATDVIVYCALFGDINTDVQFNP